MPEVQKAIRLGEPPSPTDQIRRNRPLKIVLRDRTEKEEIFKSLKNLKTADPSYRGIGVSHDYSKETRELIKLRLSEARKKDGQNAERYMYFIRGPASRLEVQRRRRKYIPQPESENDGFWVRGSLKLLLLNVRSLLNLQKRIKLVDFVLKHSFDFFLLTETWLTSDIKSSELLLSQYNVVRADRKSKNEKSKHGGRLIAVPNNVGFTEVDISHLPDAIQESLVVIKLNQPDPAVIALFYNPPKGCYFLPSISFR